MVEIGNRPLEELLRLLPGSLRSAVQNAGTDTLEEIRVRAGRPVQLLYGDKEKLLSFIAGEGFCSRLLESLSEHALFVREAELEEGFLTVRGGCRVGVAGHYALRERRVRFAEAASCNIRIAREHKSAADVLMPHLFFRNGSPKSVLLLSRPGSGKTTLLRDAARQISNGSADRHGLKVALADERGELAGGCVGKPMLDVGLRTDVMDGCKKAEAMERLIRSMSPEVIVTDELGNGEDAKAALYASSCGIALLA
ncbi:MAG: stage III sporulation protein AA, partial [Clostridiales bacterium]|nr:stage III sporulation protein AA [Clostridiales bacterium]